MSYFLLLSAAANQNETIESDFDGKAEQAFEGKFFSHRAQHTLPSKSINFHNHVRKKGGLGVLKKMGGCFPQET